MPFEEIIFDKPDFPFKLCTTTFIYPADWVANARVLGRAFDELELLLFESGRPDSLPTPKTVRALADLAADLDFTWNVHLPIDIYPGHEDPAVRRRAADVVKQVVDLTAPLTPTTHTLHLPGISGRLDETAVLQWQERTHETLARIIGAGVPGGSLTVENIPDYPLELALPLIKAFGLEICLDLGHLLLNRTSPGAAFEMFKERIALMHIHGVVGARDHCGLDELPDAILTELLKELRYFSGVVCLEVFSKKHLMASLDCLLKMWKGPGSGR